MTSDTGQLQAIADELAIRDLAARFSDTANRRDFAGFAALWAPGSEWIVNDPFPFSAYGPDDIAATVERMLNSWDLSLLRRAPLAGPFSRPRCNELSAAA